MQILLWLAMRWPQFRTYCRTNNVSIDNLAPLLSWQWYIMPHALNLLSPTTATDGQCCQSIVTGEEYWQSNIQSHCSRNALLPTFYSRGQANLTHAQNKYKRSVHQRDSHEYQHHTNNKARKRLFTHNADFCNMQPFQTLRSRHDGDQKLVSSYMWWSSHRVCGYQFQGTHTVGGCVRQTADR